MAENTAPAMCSEAVYEAARAAGLLIVTTGEEAAVQKFADAIRAEVRLEYTRPIGGGLTPDDDPLINAYAEGRKDEAEAALGGDEWVAQVVSSGRYNFPLLEWRSADVSLSTPIGTKLRVAIVKAQE